MDILQGIDASRRNPFGWIQLPLMFQALREGQRLAVADARHDRIIIGHAVREGWRWHLVPDWRVPTGTDLTPFIKEA
jgi:hypothetical protein